MAFRLPFWEQRPERVSTPSPAADPVEQANAIVDARMNVLRATLKARAVVLRAQASATDSTALRTELLARADEDDFICGQADGS